MANGVFISDLHMFSRRSTAIDHMNAIDEAAACADLLILGGDIFDFRWSRLPSFRETSDEAAKWLDGLVGRNPDTRFCYLLGNHDHNDLLIARLNEINLARSNFEWHPFYVRLATTVFLHGDVTNGRTDAAKLAVSREKWQRHAQKGFFMNWLYDQVIRLGIHKAAARLMNPNRSVAEKLLYYLEEIGIGPAQGIDTVYFGHTHKPVLDFEYRGVTFHNGGAAMKGLRFHLLEFTFPDD